MMVVVMVMMMLVVVIGMMIASHVQSATVIVSVSRPCRAKLCVSLRPTRYGDIVTFERYSAQVRAITPVGNGSWSNVVTFIIAEKGSITGEYAGEGVGKTERR